MKPKEFTLYANSSDEDREAYRLIMEAGIDCEVIGTASENLSGEETPVLYRGFRGFRGLEEIKKYVEAWKEWNTGQVKNE